MLRSALRRLLLALCAVLVVSQVTTTSIVGADTASDLEAARQKVAEAQAEANANAAELTNAEGRLDEIQGNIDQISTSIETAQVRIGELEDLVRLRAVGAYVRHGAGSSQFEAMFVTNNPMDVARREKFLDQANQTDDRNVKELDSLRADLSATQTALKKERDQQQVVKELLTAKNTALQASLVAANSAA